MDYSPYSKSDLRYTSGPAAITLISILLIGLFPSEPNTCCMNLQSFAKEKKKTFFNSFSMLT